MYHPTITFNKDLNYIKKVLEVTKKLNPNLNIHLIGNFNPKVDGIIFNEIKGCASCNNDDISRFYKHLSPNLYNPELNRILRWGYVERLCRKLKIKRFVYCDTDNLILKDLSKLNFKTDNIEVIIEDIDNEIKIVQPNIMMVWDSTILFNFIQFIIEAFIDRGSFIYPLYSNIKSKKYDFGISDGILWAEYYKRNSNKFINIRGVDEKTKSIYCSDIKKAEGLELEKEVKKIYKEYNSFYGLKNGEQVQINSIHFKDKSKILIEKWVKDNLE